MEFGDIRIELDAARSAARFVGSHMTSWRGGAGEADVSQASWKYRWAKSPYPSAALIASCNASASSSMEIARSNTLRGSAGAGATASAHDVLALMAAWRTPTLVHHETLELVEHHTGNGQRPVAVTIFERC